MTENQQKLNYKRRLPHQQPPGSIVFVTCGLAGSLPADVEAHLKQQAAQLRNQLQYVSQDSVYVDAWKKLFRYADEHWHKSNKSMHFKNPLAASVLRDAIKQQTDENRFRLHRFCIMPNHLHLLIEPMPENASENVKRELVEWPPLYYQENKRTLLAGTTGIEQLVWTPLWRIMKSIKGASAHKIGQAVGVTGRIWQPENFDHWIRNREEYERVINYIDNNPVKAGLCGRPEQWVYSSAGGKV